MRVVRLLGRPEVEIDGIVTAPPRGQKAWGILAYVILAERPVTRSELAELLFDGADDPLGALRWSLAQLRRALEAPEALRGDPVALGLPDGAWVDVIELASEAPDPAVVRGELLAGFDPAP